MKIKLDNPEKLGMQGTQGEEKQIRNTTQYVFMNTILANKHT